MIAPLVLAASLILGNGNDATRTWLVSANTDGSAQVEIRYAQRENGDDWEYNNSYTLGAGDAGNTLRGLSMNTVRTSNGEHVHFSIARDAGTLDCDGWAKNGTASGSYTISLNPNFPAELQRRGVSGTTEQLQYRLAIEGEAVFAMLDDLKREGFPAPSGDELVRMYDHGVNQSYVHGLVGIDIPNKTIDGLIRARDHGVSLKYIDALRQSGYGGLSLDDMAEAVDHGVSAKQIAGFAAAGYKHLPMSQMVEMVDHGVNASYVADVAQYGYHPSPSDLVRMRDHGVSTSFLRDLQQHGYKNLSIDDLIRLRDHGVY